MLDIRHNKLKQTVDDKKMLEAFFKEDRFQGPGSEIEDTRLGEVIEKAQKKLLDMQADERFWDGKIYDTPGLTAQFILYMHFMDNVDEEREKKAVNYLLNIQNESGSWRIYKGDNGSLSYTIHCYFALKVAGIDPDHPQMAKAREYILNNGGLEKASVETRFILALFGVGSWNSVVPVPLHLILLGKWFALSMWNMAYWIRVTLVPMGILYTRKYTKYLGADLDELWLNIKHRNRYTCPTPAPFFSLRNLFFQGSKVLKAVYPLLPKKRVMEKAINWVLKHQDESGDWGGIYPPMIYGSMMLKAVAGFDNDHPRVKKAREAIERLQAFEDDGESLIQQSCSSPIWDTSWSIIALERSGFSTDDPAIKNSTQWLYDKQIRVEGDWKVHAPDAKPGMWAFQHYNDYYPDVDDTAVVLMSLLHTLKDEAPERLQAFQAGVDWLFHMQNPDGGWAAFERKINGQIFKHIPLNDLYNYTDESTPELTGRILELFGKMGMSKDTPCIKKAVRSLQRQQEDFGSWHGKWGVHYIYGAFGVMRGLAAIGYDMNEPWVRKCVDWLMDIQQPDGGWGESCRAYDGPEFYGKGISTPSQTAWAVLSLISAGEKDSEAVEKGIRWLVDHQEENGEWIEEEFTGTGFPRAFYLRYDLYRIYFPLLALAEYAYEQKDGVS